MEIRIQITVRIYNKRWIWNFRIRNCSYLLRNQFICKYYRRVLAEFNFKGMIFFSFQYWRDKYCLLTRRYLPGRSFRRVCFISDYQSSSKYHWTKIWSRCSYTIMFIFVFIFIFLFICSLYKTFRTKNSLL